MIYDSHLHCSFSTDSTATPDEQILRCIELGLPGMTFTDHLDPDFPLDPKEFIFSTTEYFDVLSNLKNKYSDKLDIRIGVEIGMRPDQTTLLPKIATEKSYDYVIGSIHVVDGYDPYYPEYWQDKGTYEGLRRFFEITAECVEMYDFYDALGHIDYIYRYAPEDKKNWPCECFMELIDRILKALISKNKALEINTAGWKYGLEYPHPMPMILKRYLALGGKMLTIGSDGHRPEHLAYDFDRLYDYLTGLGFDSYVRFENRLPRIIPLKKPYKLAIFDMDGTILNTIDDLADATNYALGVHKLPLRTLAEVKAFVGNGILNLIKRAVPSGSSDELINAVYETFMPYYKKHCADKTCEYEGITECLRSLRAAGIKTAVVSNKADPAVAILAEQYFNGLFDISVGERPGIARKPAPDSVNEVLKALGIDRAMAVYIGDSDVDIATANNSNMDCIAVTWGFRSTELLRSVGATVFAHHPREIIDIII